MASKVKLLHWPTGWYLCIVYLSLQSFIEANNGRDQCCQTP